MESTSELDTLVQEIENIFDTYDNLSVYKEFQRILKEKIPEDKKCQNLKVFQQKLPKEAFVKSKVVDEKDFMKLLSLSYRYQKKFNKLNDRAKMEKMPKYYEKMLAMKEETEKSYELAEEKRTANLLIIGPTGAGKTSFVNLLSVVEQNKFLCQLEKVKVQTKYLSGQVSKEEEKIDGDSLTQDSQLHGFHFCLNNVGYKINLIDTPGLNDTEGMAKDDENISSIFKTLKENNDSGKEKLHGIVLLLNGTATRFTDDQNYIIRKANNIIPDLLRNNLVLVFSFVEHGSKPQFPINKLIEIIKCEIPEERKFCFQNNLFTVDFKGNEKEKAEIVEKNYMKNRLSLSKLLRTCSDLQPQPMELMSKLGEKIKIYRTNVQQLLNQMVLQLTEQDDFNKKKMEILTGKQKMQDIKSKMTKEEKKILTEEISEPTQYHNTVCNLCWNTCHLKCSLEENTEKGSKTFLGCAAFTGVQCTSCPNKCGIAEHVHHRAILSKKQVEKSSFMDDPEMKKNFEKLNGENDKKQFLLDQLNNKLTESKKIFKKIHDKIIECINNIHEECKVFDYIAEMENSNRLLGKKIYIKQQERVNNPTSQEISNELLQLEKTKLAFEEIINQFQKVNIKN